ncbi:helix-turn-helix domain-containing protein [Altererythrobacter arenosus]|uniref:Helix-turn-helix domain-containing protein n=1 Tax=Altererythrobacter arenosus TaxID=3032592 RepID=A0ABY8FUC3_9SPHN|nr:helix-turn-helix domain-containing protein [Altererythrobacter sp. CAU 1644]WFL78612.1 helix-turn-helix domain-containing protein [Altererythrobacter sp. CAU 1644]
MSETPAHRFEFVSGPTQLGKFLNSLYVLHVGEDGLEEMLPAYSGQMLIVAEGGGAMDFGRGQERAPEDAFFIGPLSAASRFLIEGPALILGASFNFHGWAAIPGLPVAQSSDRFIEIAEAFGEKGGAAAAKIAQRVRAKSLSKDRALDQIGALLGEFAQPLAHSHAELIERTYAWLSSSLNPPTEGLYEALALSNRQAQRLVKRFFGLPPSRLKRRFRAIRAATLLADRPYDLATRDEVIDAFYDQAHMIREIREFTGRTPKLLSDIDGSVISQTLGPKGYGVVGLFGGSEEEQLASGTD